MSSLHSTICDHRRLKRINQNFVRCLDCGQSMVSQHRQPLNKTSLDFTKENKSFDRNFNRNFSNVLEETDDEFTKPLYEYYTDRMWANTIIVNRRVPFQSDPVKFEVTINGSKTYLPNAQIQKILADINAVRVDEGQLMMRKKLNYKM